jgi:molybdenum cofactor cytidylyltransferase
MGRPKALLPFRGKTFLQRILDTIAESSIRRAVVVVGRHAEEIRGSLDGAQAVVFNPNYEQGMITSIQAGVRALTPGFDGAMLFLVDHPLVDVQTIESLVIRARPDRIVIPVFEGRRGHPVLFGSAVLGEILSLDSSQGANVVVRRDPGRVLQVPVTSRGVLVDVDTPEDFESLRSNDEPR